MPETEKAVRKVCNATISNGVIAVKSYRNGIKDYYESIHIEEGKMRLAKDMLKMLDESVDVVDESLRGK